jgi:hypothetical protein
MRGGHFDNDSGNHAAWNRDSGFPADGANGGLGFRVAAAAPEPSTITLLGTALLGVFVYARRAR